MKDETAAMKAKLHPSSFIPHPSKNWSGKRDLNARPSPWQGDALPLSYSRPDRRRSGIIRASCKKRQGAAAVSMRRIIWFHGEALREERTDSEKFEEG